MRFSHLVEFFEKLEKTSSRNTMIDILVELFKEADVRNIDKICYYILGEIVARYEDVRLGMGDKMVKSVSPFQSITERFHVENFTTVLCAKTLQATITTTFKKTERKRENKPL